MDLGLKGKVALVTGASRGLGKAVAEELAREGCKVALLARDPIKLAPTVNALRAEGLEVIGLTGDLLNQDEVSSAWTQVRATYGDPDIFVYNNGGPANVFFEDATDDDFLHAHEVTVRGFLWSMREALPAMKRKGWGRVVTLGSIAVKEPHKTFPLVLHNTFRPAQLGMSKTLANEYGPFGVTINTIATGTISHDGDSFVRAYAAAETLGLSQAEMDRHRVADVPVGRVGRADEMGALCAFLCSDRAGYITGQAIYLDGGRTQCPV